MKKVYLALVALLTSISVNAQLLGSVDLDPKNFPVSVSSDSMVTRAIQGSVVIVRQSYQVKNQKTGKVYGRNGRKDFGHFYSIGVKTEAGLVLTDGALKPWLYDTAFKKLGEDYEAVISLTEVREVNNSKFNQCPLQMGRQQPEGLWVANAGDVASNSMEIDQEEGKKDGWLIWFVTKKDLDTKADTKISTQSVNKKIEVNNGSYSLDVDVPVSNDLVLGGIYVCPVYLGGGHVAYRLVGVTVKEGMQWKLHTPFMEYFFEKSSACQQHQQDEPIAVEEEQEQEQEVELTPINQDKKKKKK